MGFILPDRLADTNLEILTHSLVIFNGVEYGLAQTHAGRRLVLCAPSDSPLPGSFEGEFSHPGHSTLVVGPLSAQNAAALRAQLPWLQPGLLKLDTSAGMGDRLGLATPGHVRAVRAVGSQIAPIFAQQSIREMMRTGRSPLHVMDDATWGVFQENWRNGFGADADHLKTPADIDACLAAGFTFYTIDPGAYVDDRAVKADLTGLRALVTALPVEMQLRATGLLNKTLQVEGLTLVFDEATLLRAMAKYGHAVRHVARMYRHLVERAGAGSFELEVSVDETSQPTSHAEHGYIASELKRLGVQWVSLAPRYLGNFEKGVDYIGDPIAFERDIAGHAAIARHFGPYKLSLHSGSDKFSIYPAAMRQTRGLVHLKTAGTSYLEALRTVAEVDIDLFRKIYYFARARYETDRASYHVSAQLSRAPLPEEVRDWPGLLDQFDAREILHVTFGSVLLEQTPGGEKRFYDRLMTLLESNAGAYAENLERHFIRHLMPFTAK
jgi:hypothetical protein